MLVVVMKYYRLLGRLRYLLWRVLKQLLSGVRAEFKRFGLVNSVIKTSSVDASLDSEVVISLITSRDDYMMAILALKSLLVRMCSKVQVLVIDDGSLTNNMIEDVRDHITNVRVVGISESKLLIKNKCAKYSHIVRNRQTPYVLKKVIPVLLMKARKILYLDSDMLFFKHPREIDDWISGKWKAIYLKDCEDAYMFSQVEVREYFNSSLIHKLNSGLVGINREMFDMCLLDRVLERYEDVGCYRDYHLQVYFAILLSKFLKSSEVYELPDSYFVPKMNVDVWDNDLTAVHYVQPVRERYYLDYIKVVSDLKNNTKVCS